MEVAQFHAPMDANRAPAISVVLPPIEQRTCQSAECVPDAPLAPSTQVVSPACPPSNVAATSSTAQIPVVAQPASQAPPRLPVAGTEMDTGIWMAFGGGSFRKTIPRQIAVRTGLHKEDWAKLAAELNAAIGKEIPWWSYAFKAVLLPISILLSVEVYAVQNFQVTGVLMTTFFVVGSLPLSIWLTGLTLLIGRSKIAVSTVCDVLQDLNDVYRQAGFEFDLMEKREYAKRYIQRPRPAQLGQGYVLAVRKLSSGDCGLGGRICDFMDPEAPGGYAPAESSRTQRRKPLTSSNLRRTRLRGARSTVARARRTSGGFV